MAAQSSFMDLTQDDDGDGAFDDAAEVAPNEEEEDLLLARPPWAPPDEECPRTKSKTKTKVVKPSAPSSFSSSSSTSTMKKSGTGSTKQRRAPADHNDDTLLAAIEGLSGDDDYGRLPSSFSSSSTLPSSSSSSPSSSSAVRGVTAVGTAETWAPGAPRKRSRDRPAQSDKGKERNIEKADEDEDAHDQDEEEEEQHVVNVGVSTATSANRAKQKNQIGSSDPGKKKQSDNHASALPAKKRKKKNAPEEDVMVLIDANLINEKGGDEYLSTLLSPGPDKKPVLYDVRSLPIRNSIEWRTSFGTDEEAVLNDQALRDDEQLERLKRSKTKVVDNVVVKYSGTEFGKLVRERGLKTEVDRIKAAHPEKRITFLVEGLKNFFSQESRRINRSIRGTIRGERNESDSDEYSDDNVDNIRTSSDRRVSKSMVDDAFVWLQIEGKCHVRKTDSVAESAGYIYRLTLAIANAPYRYTYPTTKRSVKNATIGEIWIKQLQQLNKVSVTTATAIANSYPTFRSLMSVYQSKGLTEQQKELLLQNIKVGSVGRERSIGPVLSKKIYHFFTDEDGSQKMN